MSSAVQSTIPAITGFTEEAFEAFLRDRDDPTWLVERRREAFARFQAFAWPSVREEEWRRTDIRAAQDRYSFAPPAAGEPSVVDRAAFDQSWQSLSSHYATGIAHIAGAARRAEPIPRGAGTGQVFVDLDRGCQKPSQAYSRRYLLTEAVLPSADKFTRKHPTRHSGRAERCFTSPGA